MLRNVSLTIPYSVEGDALKADLLVPKDAVFDESADTGSFGNYEKGDTPYEWIVRNYDLMKEDTDQYLMNGPARSGVFEVGIKDNKITTYSMRHKNKYLLRCKECSHSSEKNTHLQTSL